MVLIFFCVSKTEKASEAMTGLPMPRSVNDFKKIFQGPATTTNNALG